MIRSLVLLGLAGCLERVPVQQAVQPVPIAIAGVVESAEDRTVWPVPDAVISAVAEQVSMRNLTPVIPPEALLTALRTTPARLTMVSEHGGAPVVLLVETRARFSSQMNGRYRWTVDVAATIAPADGSAGQTEVFTVPVALVYYHEQEDAAVAQAAPLIAREVGALLDEWVATGATAP